MAFRLVGERLVACDFDYGPIPFPKTPQEWQRRFEELGYGDMRPLAGNPMVLFHRTAPVPADLSLHSPPEYVLRYLVTDSLVEDILAGDFGELVAIVRYIEPMTSVIIHQPTIGLSIQQFLKFMIDSRVRAEMADMPRIQIPR